MYKIYSGNSKIWASTKIVGGSLLSNPTLPWLRAWFGRAPLSSRNICTCQALQFISKSLLKVALIASSAGIANARKSGHKATTLLGPGILH